MRYCTTEYRLISGDEVKTFLSEKDACDYLGVSKCSVASCYRRGTKCKGYKVERIGITTHHATGTRLFKIWEGMLDRCNRPKHRYFNDYGGRGISVCDEWKEFVPFYEWAVAAGYSDGLSLDRKDYDKGYSPDNCRWATMQEQQNNKRNNRIVEYNGSNYTMTELARLFGIKKTTLKERLNSGWSVYDAVNRPVRKRTCGYRPSEIFKMDGGVNGEHA